MVQLLVGMPDVDPMSAIIRLVRLDTGIATVRVL